MYHSTGIGLLKLMTPECHSRKGKRALTIFRAKPHILNTTHVTNNQVFLALSEDLGISETPDKGLSNANWPFLTGVPHSVLWGS